MKRFIFMMIFVLGAFVVKGFTSVCPTIKTDNKEVKKGYSCETINLSSEGTVIQEIGLPINFGNFILKSEKFIVNKDKEKAINFIIEDIDYLPDLRNKNMIKNYAVIIKRMIAKSSGGLPYTPKTLFSLHIKTFECS